MSHWGSNDKRLLNYGNTLVEKRAYVLAIVVTVTVSFLFANLDFPPIAKLVANQFGLSDVQIGLVTSFFFIPYASMQIPGGYLADRFGAARSLAVATFVMSLAPLIFL